MAKYYIKVVGRPFGPIDAEKIVQMVTDGKLTRESEISANRLDWRRIDDVDELRQALSVGLPSAAPFSGGGAAMEGGDAKVWYVTNDGVTQYGPMSRNEILRALQSGQIQPTASAWRDGEQARPISDIPAFRTQNVAPVEKKEWYYSPDGQTGYGPYGVSDILAFVEQGRANFDSLVWRLNENSRPMRNEPVFMNAYNAAHSGMAANATPIPSVNVGLGANNSREDDIYGATSMFNAEKRNKRIRFLYTATWVGLIVAFACAVLSTCLYSLNATKAVVFISAALMVVSVVASFFIATTSFILTYNFWKSIPIKFARTSSGIAIGLLFVPLFNLYWCFVTLVGGARDLDSALGYYEQHGMNHNERPKFIGIASMITLAVLYDVLFVAGVIATILVIPGVTSETSVLFDEVGGFLTFGLSIFEYALLCGLMLMFPLCFSGCLTGFSTWLAAFSVRIMFTIEGATEDLNASFWFFWIVNLVLPFYPLFFILCVRKMKNAALQMNYWRAGSPSARSTEKNAPRVTLDDIMNS